MQIQRLLFDADNTLIDFSNASKAAFWQTFEDYGHTCTDDIHATYQPINHQVWTDFEQGKITAKRLRVKRFADLFEAIDLSPALPEDFSKRYLENLIIKSESYDGVKEMLDGLHSYYHMSIITNGLREVQRPRLRKLDMTHYFDSIIVSDEIGIAKPDERYFEIAFHSIDNPPPRENTLVIGDNLKSDILGGIRYGLKTCWLNASGKANDTDIKPDYEIQNILELPDLLKNMQEANE